MGELVACHAGYAYPVRPRAFHWAGRRYEVAEVLDQARTPEGKRFRVRTSEGQIFELFYAESLDEWRIHQP